MQVNAERASQLTVPDKDAYTELHESSRGPRKQSILEG